MKKLIALLLVLSSLVTAVACGKEPAPDTGKNSESDSSSSGAVSETPADDEEEEPLLPFGVYYLVNDKGQKLGRNKPRSTMKLGAEEKSARFTVYYRTCNDGKKHYMFYEGDDTRTAFGYKSNGIGQEVGFFSDAQSGSNGNFELIPSADGTSFKIVASADPNLCIGYDKDGLAVLVSAEDDAPSSYWKIEEAEQNENYVAFTSQKGHIVLRIPQRFTTRSNIGFNKKIAQMWVNYFEEAYFYEIELTGYIPYDVIVIKAYEQENIVAGVVNNYNVITADVGFMESELTNVAKRYTQHNVVEVNFGMLHEMGHMFDSNRGWNFESEAWTDLKLCYCLKKLEEAHPDVTFAATPFGYATSKYFTYDTMVECLGQHDNPQEGGMTTVYAYFGCAKIFLIIANEIGWDYYVQTFHWFQDNNVLQDNLERVDRYYKFVEKLGEFSGRDIHSMIDKINPKAWDVMVDYFSGKTNAAV